MTTEHTFFKLAFFAFLLAAPTAAGAQDDPSDCKAAKYADLVRRISNLQDDFLPELQTKKEAIAKLLEKAEKATVNPRFKKAVTRTDGSIIVPSKEAKSDRIASLEKRLSEIDEEIAALKRKYLPSPFPADLKVGDLGALPATLELVQVIDEKTMLVHGTIGFTVEKSKNGPSVVATKKTVWLSGVDTSGLIDDDEVQLTGLFEIIGRRQYEAVSGGLTTIFEIAPASPIEFARYSKSIEASPNPRAQKAEPK